MLMGRRRRTFLLQFRGCGLAPRLDLVVAMALVGSRRYFIAMITAETTRLVMSSDDATIAARISALDVGALLVSGAFGTSSAAVCWLTDPVSTDAVHASQLMELPRHSSAPAAGRGWLAVMATGSSACFEIDSAGVGGAVMLLKASRARICAVARLADAAGAYNWLVSRAVKDLLDLMSSTAWSFLQRAAPRIDAPAPSQSTAVLQAKSVVRPKQVAPALEPASHRAAYAAVRSDARVVPHGSTGLRGEVLDTVLVESSMPTRSPFAVWAAREEAVEPVDEERSKRSHFQSGPRSRKRGARAVSPSSDAQSSALAPAAAVDSPGLTRQPRSSRAARMSPPVRARCSHDLGDGGHGPEYCRECEAPASRPLPKIARLASFRGAPDALNPAADDVGRAEPLFSRAGISRMMAETQRAWDEADAAATAAASRRNADRRFAVGNDGCSTSVAESSSGARQVHSRWTETTVQEPTAVDAGAHAGTGGARRLCAPSRSPPSVADRSDVVGSDPEHGPLGRLAAAGDWPSLYEALATRGQSTFVTGGPGVGKSSFLRGLRKVLCSKMPNHGEVVVVAPTGSAAKTAHGQTYHTFFGFVRDYKAHNKDPVREAQRLLQSDRFAPIRKRLAQVRVLLLDEVSMVAADNLDIMYELLKQSRGEADRPFTVFAFGDFLQLGPLFGSMAFEAKAWPLLFGGSMLELTHVHRQGQPDFVRAIKDPRFGRCTNELTSRMKECSVSAEQYKAMKCKVLHLMPRHEDVQKHNAECLAELSAGRRPADFEAVDFVQEDKDRDMGLHAPSLHRVSTHSRDAALFDCVAPRRVPHCQGARVMLTTNAFLSLGLYHGSIGSLDSYEADGTPVVHFTHHALPPGVGRGMHGVRDAGQDWIKVACPPVNFEARILAHPGAVAVRFQVPFVLGWAITVHRSQSLTLSEAVLDVAGAFGAGMVNAAISRVDDKRCMYVKSFAGNRVLADPSSLAFYRDGTRL